MATPTQRTCITSLVPQSKIRAANCDALEKRIDAVEKDWLAKVDQVLPSERENYKTKVRYFVNELRAQIIGAKNCVNRSFELSSRIDRMISAYDTQLQAHYIHNEEFARDTRKVHEGNLALGTLLRKMTPDLAPFQQKPGPNATPVINEPHTHQLTMQKGYEQITKIEQDWYEKAKHLPPDEQADYCDKVARYVGNLNKNVPLFKDADPRLLEQSIQENARIYDDFLEKSFQHHSREEWSIQEVDPLF